MYAVLMTADTKVKRPKPISTPRTIFSRRGRLSWRMKVMLRRLAGCGEERPTHGKNASRKSVVAKYEYHIIGAAVMLVVDQQCVVLSVRLQKSDIG